MTTEVTWIEEDWTAEATHPPFSLGNYFKPRYQAKLWPQPVDYPFFKSWTERDWNLYRRLVERKIKANNKIIAKRQKELDILSTLIDKLTVN